MSSRILTAASDLIVHAVVALIGCRRARDLPAPKHMDGDEYRQAESGSFGPGSPEKERSTSFGFLRMLAPRTSSSRRGFWTASTESEQPARARPFTLERISTASILRASLCTCQLQSLTVLVLRWQASCSVSARRVLIGHP